MATGAGHGPKIPLVSALPTADSSHQGRLLRTATGLWSCDGNTWTLVAANGPTWGLTSLSTPPLAWFDADADENLVTTTTNGLAVSSMASKFNSGTYSGTPTALTLQTKNPYFGGRRAIHFPGSTGSSKLQVTGGGNLCQNKMAITMVALVRFLTERPTAASAAIMFAGTPTADTVRFNIATSASVSQGLRYGGRATDGGASDIEDVGNERGASPFLVWAEADYTNGVKRMYVNDVLIGTDSAFLTAGTGTSNTASAFFGFGSSGTQAYCAMEMHAGGVFDTILGTSDRNKVAGLLMNRTGNNDLLASAHPYRYAPP